MTSQRDFDEQFARYEKQNAVTREKFASARESFEAGMVALQRMENIVDELQMKIRRFGRSDVVLNMEPLGALGDEENQVVDLERPGPSHTNWGQLERELTQRKDTTTINDLDFDFTVAFEVIDEISLSAAERHTTGTADVNVTIVNSDNPLSLGPVYGMTVAHELHYFTKETTHTVSEYPFFVQEIGVWETFVLVSEINKFMFGRTTLNVVLAACPIYEIHKKSLKFIRERIGTKSNHLRFILTSTWDHILLSEEKRYIKEDDDLELNKAVMRSIRENRALKKATQAHQDSLPPQRRQAWVNNLECPRLVRPDHTGKYVLTLTNGPVV